MECPITPQTGPLWDDLNSDLVECVRGLVDLLPPLFLAPPPLKTSGRALQSGLHNEVAFAPIPLMSVFSEDGRLVLSSALEGQAGSVFEFVNLRALALHERGLSFASNWTGTDLQMFARAIAACVGLRPFTGEQERVVHLRRSLEVSLSGQTVSQESIRCVSVCLEAEKRLPGMIAAIRLAAARTALVQQRNIRAAYEAYTAAQEDANGVLSEQRGISIDHELTELVRWYSSSDFKQYLHRWTSPPNGEKVK